MPDAIVIILCVLAAEVLAKKETLTKKKKGGRVTSSEIIKKIKPRCKYAAEVQAWVERVIIGLGLCPWATRTYRLGHLRYVTCDGRTPSDVARLIAVEAEKLDRKGVAPLTTTLIVCPHVVAWENFNAFDVWVESQIENELGTEELARVRDKVYLVSFHPQFLRWQELAQGITVGSIVQAYYFTKDGVKSHETTPATVVDFDESDKFASHNNLVVRCHNSSLEAHSLSGDGPPLPDNFIHRSPYPTIHLIRQDDLDAVTEKASDATRKRNARLIRELGCEGLQNAAR